MNEWMNEKKIYIARLKAYKCMLDLLRLTENSDSCFYATYRVFINCSSSSSSSRTKTWNETDEQKKNGPARSPWDQSSEYLWWSLR